MHVFRSRRSVDHCFNRWKSRATWRLCSSSCRDSIIANVQSSLVPTTPVVELLQRHVEANEKQTNKKSCGGWMKLVYIMFTWPIILSICVSLLAMRAKIMCVFKGQDVWKNGGRTGRTVQYTSFILQRERLEASTFSCTWHENEKEKAWFEGNIGHAKAHHGIVIFDQNRPAYNTDVFTMIQWSTDNELVTIVTFLTDIHRPAVIALIFRLLTVVLLISWLMTHRYPEWTYFASVRCVSTSFWNWKWKLVWGEGERGGGWGLGMLREVSTC